MVNTITITEGLKEFFSYTTSSFLLEGALTALQIAFLAIIGGVILGLLLAVMRLSRFKVLQYLSRFYIWFMRGTPIILQLVFLYDALPFIGIRLDEYSTAVIGFTLNEAAFCAEIIRAGIISIDSKQSDAAAAFGMSPLLSLKRIILPQAIKVMIPNMTNQAISLVKATSIASIIFVNELTFRSQQIVGQNFKFFTVFAAAGLMYLIITSCISLFSKYLEIRLSTEKSEKNSRISALIAPIQPVLAFPVHTGLHFLAYLKNRHSNNNSDKVKYAAGKTRDFLASTDNNKRNPLLKTKIPYIECQQVSKSYGSRGILEKIDFTIYEGEVIALMGPSGSGKSTLLKLINHLESVDKGEIKINQAYIGYKKAGDKLIPCNKIYKSRANARIAMVFQHFNLFHHLTALENVMEAPIQVHGESAASARFKAEQALTSVGLQDFLHSYPHKLSGGQQQRVAIARAMAISPKLILFDEPTSALDPELVKGILNIIRSLAETGITMIIATHEVRFAQDVADRILFMDSGKIIESGSPIEVIHQSRHARTQQFFSDLNHEAEKIKL